MHANTCIIPSSPRDTLLHTYQLAPHSRCTVRAGKAPSTGTDNQPGIMHSVRAQSFDVFPPLSYLKRTRGKIPVLAGLPRTRTSHSPLLFPTPPPIILVHLPPPPPTCRGSLPPGQCLDPYEGARKLIRKTGHPSPSDLANRIPNTPDMAPDWQSNDPVFRFHRK